MIDDPQSKVYEAVKKRGYRDGWTPEQYLARQIAKMVEELIELKLTISIQHPGDSLSNPEWYHRLNINIQQYARCAFDNYGTGEWFVDIHDLKQAKKEAADLQVVLFQIAEAIGEIDGKPFDVVQAAVDKAQKDIERGVR